MQLVVRSSWQTCALLALAMTGCGDDGAGTVVVDGGIDGAHEAAREVIGTIDVYEQRYVYIDEGPPQENLWSNVRAAFHDGGAPRWHREVARAGACVLKRYTPSSCEPACTDGLCVETNVCERVPALVAAGRMVVRGLTVGLRIAGIDGYYYPDGALPADLFADNATISAEISGGGGLPGFTVSTSAVPPLRGAILGGKLVLVFGNDATVRWTPAAGASRVRLTLNSNNLGHGQPFLGIIECDVADAAGEITIDQSLMDAFPETQAWRICAGTDCPPSTLRRYHRATFPVGDRDIELIVASEIAFGVDHILPD